MWCRTLILLAGAVFIYHQVYAADTYVAELMIESNVTLDSNTILSALNFPNLTVPTNSGNFQLNISQAKFIAECMLVEDNTSCNCAEGYIWSNQVCYNTKTCCNESSCYANVSHFTPLCIAKVKVHINGSIAMQSSTWTNSHKIQLIDAMKRLNGFDGLNVTGLRDGDVIADFEADVSVKFETSRLQNEFKNLEANIDALIQADTLGMVNIESPDTTVCYLSEPSLKCTFNEESESAGWNMSMKNERFELNSGSLVSLDKNCATKEFKSCVGVTLKNVTNNWAGAYECGFTIGSIRHRATTVLDVAALPDEITVITDPLTVDCSKKTANEIVKVKVTAIIPNATKRFDVTWSYRGIDQKEELQPESSEDRLYYKVDISINCMYTPDAQYVNFNFKNQKNQQKSGRVDIPVLYAGQKYCMERHDSAFWPKTPSGATVINRTCESGRVGYKERTCESTEWQRVFPYHVNKELIKVLNAARKFEQGLGATQEVALEIFARLKNNMNTSDNDGSDNSMADLIASINILSTMASASSIIPLQEEVFPNFINAASTMLSQSWGGVNRSIEENMASNYLKSVEDLVKNINMNNNNGFCSQNLDLTFCRAQNGSHCKPSVFGVNITLNGTSGIIKTIGIKNLGRKLKNNHPDKRVSSLLVSTTVTNHRSSLLDITLDFPCELQEHEEALCVFWNTSMDEWSTEGCQLTTGDNDRTICRCNHLTAFSVLMSKKEVNLPFLDEITYVGLGMSICSLLVLIIIEALVWSAVVKSNLSYFRHTALVNISICLLLGHCSLLASSHKLLSDTCCLFLTVCKHFFFLAMFCWMLCLSILLVHQLIFVFSPLRKRIFMFFSSIIGYVLPIIIVGATYMYYKYTGEPYHNKKECWLTYERLLKGSIHSFILPVGTAILINLFCMGMVIVTLVKSSLPDSTKADDKETAKSILKAIVFLTPVFGVTWILGFFLFMDIKDPLSTIIHYTFTILNSFQGLFILITACFAEKKVRDELLKLIKAKGPSKVKK
ncbi:adhesion G-protein coupled receptor F3 [Lampris incognitus]|uniref:adhesion G-protein coupled receptor F3 n=1 Tax=Lampris incognitus TaxID=2546036 RepID=UPI0024B5BE0A|nr:adhesion G-protein coupled receptor F3 [Lampris incognitus]